MENQLMKTASFLYNETDGRTDETAIRGDEVLLRGGRVFRTDAGDRELRDRFLTRTEGMGQ